MGVDGHQCHATPCKNNFGRFRVTLLHFMSHWLKKKIKLTFCCRRQKSLNFFLIIFKNCNIYKRCKMLYKHLNLAPLSSKCKGAYPQYYNTNTLLSFLNLFEPLSVELMKGALYLVKESYGVQFLFPWKCASFWIILLE